VNTRRSRFIVGLALAIGTGLGLLISVTAQSQGMGSGMMGGGMMGGGMMRGAGPRDEAPGEGGVSNPAWRKLTSYVKSNGLACMSCHTLSGRSTGPAFIDIAHRFAGQANAKTGLASAISNGVSGQWPGYPPMPGGLAKPKQARKLAGLILQLAH
jgi:cytochrome c